MWFVCLHQNVRPHRMQPSERPRYGSFCIHETSLCPGQHNRGLGKVSRKRRNFESLSQLLICNNWRTYVCKGPPPPYTSQEFRLSEFLGNFSRRVYIWCGGAVLVTTSVGSGPLSRSHNNSHLNRPTWGLVSSPFCCSPWVRHPLSRKKNNPEKKISRSRHLYPDLPKNPTLFFPPILFFPPSFSRLPFFPPPFIYIYMREREGGSPRESFFAFPPANFPVWGKIRKLEEFTKREKSLRVLQREGKLVFLSSGFYFLPL